MEPVYSWIEPTLRAWTKVMGWKVIIRGEEHIPPRGSGIIATNHIGYLDWLFVGLAAANRGRHLRVLAKKELWDNLLTKPIMVGSKNIPVDRYGGATAALAATIEALRHGELVGMFPESTIARSFVPAKGKTGAARMAMGAGAPLIPGALWGSQRMLTKGRPRNVKRGIAVTVVFGPPVGYEPDESAAAVTERLMAAIGSLLDEAIRIYPQRPTGDDDRWWVPAHLGGTAPSVEESEAMASRDLDERIARRRAERSRQSG
jgi:1-acyl-sn-glycerol-3-phosphate acyltransferase